LAAFEKRIFRRVFGPKREEVVGYWRRLHNEELHNLYTSPDIRLIKSSRTMWVAHLALVGEMRNVYKILVRKPEGKRPLKGPRCR